MVIVKPKEKERTQNALKVALTKCEGKKPGDRHVIPFGKKECLCGHMKRKVMQ